MAESRASRPTMENATPQPGRYEKLYAMLLDAIPSSVLISGFLSKPFLHDEVLAITRAALAP